ncbi:MAG: ribonuclease P protein subunit [archaeon]|nr:ribonuclease P protein subunit [archaeon]
MNKRDLMRMEFIGLNVSVLSTPCYSGISGVVVDETKNTFVVNSGGYKKIIPKPGNMFEFTHEDKKFVIMGTDVRYRPEDRIKKVR